MGLREAVVAIATEEKIDLVGFATVQDVELAYPPRPAEDLLRGTKTVIAFAAALLWGALNSPRGTKGAVKDSQIAYHRLESAAAAVGRFLESEGFACYAPPASMPVDVIQQNGRSWLAAEWSHRQAAIAAGLGIKGLNNLLITPEYGPYVRLSSMLTTAVLEPSQKRDLDNLCDHCLRCVKACPVHALNDDPQATPRLNQPVCKTYYVRPFLYPTAFRSVRSLMTTPGIGTAAIQYLLEGYYFCCAECQRVCPAGRLSKRKKARAQHESIQ